MCSVVLVCVCMRVCVCVCVCVRERVNEAYTTVLITVTICIFTYIQLSYVYVCVTHTNYKRRDYREGKLIFSANMTEILTYLLHLFTNGCKCPAYVLPIPSDSD